MQALLKRLLLGRTSLYCLLLSVFAFTAPAAAVNVFSGTCSNPSYSSQSAVCSDVNAQASKGNTDNPVVGVIKVIISVMALIVGVVSVIILMVSAFRLVTSNGDAQAVTKARSAIIYALAGLVIAALAEFIVAFALKRIA